MQETAQSRYTRAFIFVILTKSSLEKLTTTFTRQNLVLHLQSFTFPSKTYPEIAAKSSYSYTLGELLLCQSSPAHPSCSSHDTAA